MIKITHIICEEEKWANILLYDSKLVQTFEQTKEMINIK